jgi:hypothetical protein
LFANSWDTANSRPAHKGTNGCAWGTGNCAGFLYVSTSPIRIYDQYAPNGYKCLCECKLKNLLICKCSFKFKDLLILDVDF